MLIYQSLLSLAALFFGSLTGVFVKRIPEAKNIVFARSQCPSCGKQLAWYENIPLLSYLFLLGKCSACKTKIPLFYPFIEFGFLLCALPFINIAAKRFVVMTNASYFELALILLDFLFYMAFISIALSLGLIDQKTKQLPHKLTYSGILLGIVYVSLFASPYYSVSESLIESFDFLPSFLLSTISAIKHFAIIVFTLDIFVYFTNLIFFRENALLEISNALTLGQRKLEEKAKLVYLIYLIIVLTLIYLGQSFYLEVFFIVLGLLYIFFEIFAYFFVKVPQAESLKTIEEKRTVLGGGDIMMLGFMASLMGYQKTSLIFLSSFYIAFIFLLLKIIGAYFSFQIEARKVQSEEDQDKQISPQSFDIREVIRGTIPLGLALALSFIAVMMMLAK